MSDKCPKCGGKTFRINHIDGIREQCQFGDWSREIQDQRVQVIHIHFADRRTNGGSRSVSKEVR